MADFYSLLRISRDASPRDIKTAYHRALLRLHPDKNPRPRARIVIDATTPVATRLPDEGSADMALLSEAYRTLSDMGLRGVYDGSLKRQEHAESRGPRPAQAVSLEEFDTTETDTETDQSAVQAWRHECRCGGMYRITEDDLENGMHLVGCESCSEVIWVGYEEVATEDMG